MNTSYWQGKVDTLCEKKGEDNEVDFKENLSEDGERLKEHVNAMANNANGGIFVFGINKHCEVTKEIIDTDNIVKHFTNLAQDTQDPSLTVRVQHLLREQKPLLGIEILPPDTRPVFIKDRAPLGGRACFKRSGASSVPMRISEVRELLARSEQFNPDEEVVLDAKVENLNLITLEETIKGFKASRGFDENNLLVLQDNKIVTKQGGNDWQPTLAGWLMFANNPQQIRKLRNAIVEFQQFKSKSREEPIKKLEIMGTLPQQVQLSISTVTQNLWTIPKIQGVRREDIPAYEETTLREVIVNSIVHRDYRQLHQPVKIALFSDRIEIENPGGLLPGLTPLNLMHKREWRNPNIANLMVSFKLGEMDGQGIDRIYMGTRRLKVPAPRILDDNKSFKMILSAPKAYEEYSPEEKKLTILILLIMESTLDNESVRNAFGIDLNKASTLLKSLVEDNFIEKVGKSSRYAKYTLSQEWKQKIE